MNEFDFNPERTAAMEKEWKRKADFTVTLKSGQEVRVHFKYIVREMPHFEFRGDCISDTGYQSHSPGFGNIEMDDDELKEYALAVCEMYKKQYEQERQPEARRRRKKSA